MKSIIKVILTFIFRLCNIIYYVIGAPLAIITFPVLPIFVYLFFGIKVFDYDYDPEKLITYINDKLHYPLDMFEKYINTIDNTECKMTNKFWQ